MAHIAAPWRSLLMHLVSGRPPAAVLLLVEEKTTAVVVGGGGGETAGAEAVLRAHERLHAAHGAVNLAPHLVPAHQSLQAHQTAQCGKGSPSLQHEQNAQKYISSQHY
jgi:hypothetical protein